MDMDQSTCASDEKQNSAKLVIAGYSHKNKRTKRKNMYVTNKIYQAEGQAGLIRRNKLKHEKYALRMDNEFWVSGFVRNEFAKAEARRGTTKETDKSPSITTGFKRSFCEAVSTFEVSDCDNGECDCQLPAGSSSPLE